MVKVTKEVSDRNRSDVLDAAGRVIREHGLAEATVSAIGREAGLTHGAVYRHFTSKNNLAASAIARDFGRIVEMLETMAAEGGDISDYVAAYLAGDHRDHYIWGCPAAPLAAEMHRADGEVQTAFHEGLVRNLEAIAALHGPGTDDQRFAGAIAVLSTLSGAMALSRAVKETDPALSARILQAAKDDILHRLQTA